MQIKKYFQIGEVFQRIQATNTKNDILSLLKWNWGKIYNPIYIPHKYDAKRKVLTILVDTPEIYLGHLKTEIKEKCNNFLGYEAVAMIKFVQK